MLIFSYYDIFNNRIVPEWVSYSFIIASLITFFVLLPFEIIKIGISVLVFIIGYIIYRIGYLGGADVFVITGLCLLLPLNVYGIPTIILLLLGSMLLTMIYVIVNFFLKVKKMKFEKNDMITSLLWFLGYGTLSYMIYNLGQISVAVSLLFLGIINSLFALIKTNLMESMIDTIPLEKVIEEDILVIDKMDKKFVEENKIDRLLTKEQINKLRELGVKKVPVYTGLPAYLPFVSIVTILLFILSLY